MLKQLMIAVALAGVVVPVSVEAAPTDEREPRIVFSRRVGLTDDFDLWIMNADGSEQRQLTDNPDDDLHADASPDGRRVVYVRAPAGDYIRANPRGDLWILDVETGEESPLVVGAEAAYRPSWSPDGKVIAYSREAETLPGVHGTPDLWRITPEGGGNESLSDTATESENFPSWAPDNTRMTFVRAVANVGIREGDGTMRTVVPGQAPQWSPGDASTIAFQNADDGDLDLYVLDVTSSAVRLLRDTDDAHERFVTWSPDGATLAWAHVPKEGACIRQHLGACPSHIRAASYTSGTLGEPRPIGAREGVFDNLPTFLPPASHKPLAPPTAPSPQEVERRDDAPTPILPETGGRKTVHLALLAFVLAAMLHGLNSAPDRR